MSINDRDAKLVTAIQAGDLQSVTTTLQESPTLSLGQSQSVVDSILDHPNADILRALCTHDPSFVNFSVDYAVRTLFTEACLRPPEQIEPLLHVLIDHKVDLYDGCWGGTGPLMAAIQGKQSVNVLRRLLDIGARANRSHVLAAIRIEHEEAVDFLFGESKVEASVNAEECVEAADATGNETIIKKVSSWAQRRVNEKSKWQFWK